ncbi:MAG TPA: A24 family peptidase [Allosphingosinicella sp.]|uniref:prepilin peptidase n=1 Tax=Allosphingosinicella sp. TaxID=2823234 RepID=UPI002F2AD4B7
MAQAFIEFMSAGAAGELVRGGLGIVLGLLVGSFLATVLLRWPEGRSALRGRSACDGCGRQLTPAELVPTVSWAVLNGRCRTCGTRIAPEHLIVELAAALIGAVALLAHSGLAGGIAALFGWWLLLVAALDAKHHWLPDRLTLPLIPAGLAVAVAGIGADWQERAVGAAVGFFVLAGVALGYRLLRRREGMGGGDPKLLAGIGAWLGWQQLPFVLLGAGLLGLAAVLLKRLRGGEVKATDRLALGALMALAAWPLWLLSVAVTQLT